MSKRTYLLRGLFLLIVVGLGASLLLLYNIQQRQPGPTRKVFAEKIEGFPGVKNLGKINENLYRGAQPTFGGLKNLKELGIKTIINLRTMHGEREECEELGLRYYHLRMKFWDEPEAELVEEFMEIVTDPENQPALFHCSKGSDRTGTMAALYRIIHEGWQIEDVLGEMEYFGYHDILDDLKDYVENFDVEGFRSFSKEKMR